MSELATPPPTRRRPGLRGSLGPNAGARFIGALGGDLRVLPVIASLVVIWLVFYASNSVFLSPRYKEGVLILRMISIGRASRSSSTIPIRGQKAFLIPLNCIPVLTLN